MARENPYFLLSGLLSLSLFFSVMALCLAMMLSNKNIQNYALEKDTFVSVSLDFVKIPTVVHKEKSVVLTKSSPIVQETKEVDIANLFSDVWTKDIALEKKEVVIKDTKRLERIEKKLDTARTNEVKQVEESLDTSEKSIQDIKTKKSSTASEVNEYFAKIQAIVYRHFTPPANSEGHTVKAIIELSAIGKVQDFRILTYSANEALNEECDNIKSRLQYLLFPVNPQGEASRITVDIRSDKN